MGLNKRENDVRVIFWTMLLGVSKSILKTKEQVLK